MTLWQTILTGLCICLAAFLCWQEARRPDKTRLAARIAASLVAVAAFAGLLLPITHKTDKPLAAGSSPAILLTEGFMPDSVSRFLRQAGDSIPVYVLDPGVPDEAHRFHAQAISAADWNRITPQVSAIHIFGSGLEADQLRELPPARFVFHPSTLPEGIPAAQWPTRLSAGDPLLVQGSYANTAASQVMIVLSGYDTDLDTAIVPAHSDLPFSVSTTPRQLGRAVFSLKVVSGGKVLEEEPVPFEVEPAGTLKVFMLSASPDFETKFLKLWLSQNSYELVTRSTISKDKYEKTFTNTPRIDFNQLTPQFLRDVDVMIADQSALVALSAAEMGAIEAQVARRGMGLIVRGDSTGSSKPFYARPFPVVQDAGQNQKTLSLVIPAGNPSGTALNVEHPAYIRPQPGTQPLITDKASNTVVSNSLYGAGKLLYSTITSTATWMLSGNHRDYQSYWSCLLDKATARLEKAWGWSFGPDFPTVNKPVTVRYASNSTDMPDVQMGQDRVPLAQDADLPFQWQGTYWPQREGWQPAMAGSETAWWYAYGPGDWKTAAALQRTALTRQALPATGDEQTKSSGPKALASVPVSKIWFLVPFFLSLAFLWIEKKL